MAGVALRFGSRFQSSAISTQNTIAVLGALRGFTATARETSTLISKTLSGLKRVEEILTRDEASRRYHLMASRIGDLVILGDRENRLWRFGLRV